MRSLDNETAYWSISYENLVKIVKEEINEVKKLFKVQSNDDVYFDEEVDYDSVSHSMKETNNNNDYSYDNNICLKQTILDELDDNGYDEYGGYNEYDECDRDYYYCDGRYERRGFSMIN